jgi:hypothetical protein
VGFVHNWPSRMQEQWFFSKLGMRTSIFSRVPNLMDYPCLILPKFVGRGSLISSLNKGYLYEVSDVDGG